MALTPSEADELARELQRHAIHLQDHLGAEDYWTADRHIPVAVQLRVLLCDGDLPVLLVFARHSSIRLRVWGPRPAGKPHHPDMLFSWSALIASWHQMPDAHEMSIEEFLATEVAVVSTAQKGSAVTPTQVIKWVANKEGAAHFSLDKPAALRSMKESKWSRGEAEVSSFQAKQILHAVGLWTHSAIRACFGVIPPNG